MPDHRTNTQIGVLGALNVRGGAGEVAIPRGQASSLLEWLVAHRVGGVSADATMAALWSSSSATAVRRDALRGYLSRLRRRLAEAGDDLIVRRPGDRIGLNVETVEVDVDTFDDELGQGLDHLADGHPGAALDLLDRGLAKWRGHPYQALGDTAVGITESVRLGRMRGDGEVARCAAWIASDRPGRAIPVLDGILESEPLRERAWRLLMLALADAGRRADAARAFQRCRAALAEIDHDPAPSTVDLDRRLFTGERLGAAALVHREYAGRRDRRPSAHVSEAPAAPAPPGPRVVIAVTDDPGSSVDRLRALAGPETLVLDLTPAPTPSGGPLDPLAAVLESAEIDDIPHLDHVVGLLRSWPPAQSDEEGSADIRIDCLSATTQVLDALVRRRPVWAVVPDIAAADLALPTVLRHVTTTMAPGELIVVLVATTAASRRVITATDEVLTLP